jgi:hypothetical membrane protein
MRTLELLHPAGTWRRGTVHSARAVPLWVLICSASIPVLLTSGWAVAGVVQPPSYSPMRETVSALAGRAGTDRWIVTSALIVVGVCYLATAAGLTIVRRRARVALAVSGIASMGIAASPEPVVGSTVRHMAFTVIGAALLAIWPALTAQRGLPASQLTSIPAALAVTGAFLVMLGWLYLETRNGPILGLAERLDSSVQAMWPFIVAVSLSRTTVDNYEFVPDRR